MTLNREPLAASVSPASVTMTASGGDGSFDDGTDIPVIPASVVANGNTIEVGMAGLVAMNDVYRIEVSEAVVDQSGIPLDGDGDGSAGGTYSSVFEVMIPPATLSQIQQEILTPNCATSGCHVPNNPPDGLLLTDGNTWSNTVNVAAVQRPGLMRIEPGNPDNSYLVKKIEGVDIEANRMPLGRDPLSAEQIELIRRWVAEGALDN